MPGYIMPGRVGTACVWVQSSAGGDLLGREGEVGGGNKGLEEGLSLAAAASELVEVR